MTVKDLIGILEMCNEDAVVGLEIGNQKEALKFVGNAFGVKEDNGNIILYHIENGTKRFSKRLLG